MLIRAANSESEHIFLLRTVEKGYTLWEIIENDKGELDVIMCGFFRNELSATSYLFSLYKMVKVLR